MYAPVKGHRHWTTSFIVYYATYGSIPLLSSKKSSWDSSGLLFSSAQSRYLGLQPHTRSREKLRVCVAGPPAYRKALKMSEFLASIKHKVALGEKCSFPAQYCVEKTLANRLKRILHGRNYSCYIRQLVADADHALKSRSASTCMRFYCITKRRSKGRHRFYPSGHYSGCSSNASCWKRRCWTRFVNAVVDHLIPQDRVKGQIRTAWMSVSFHYQNFVRFRYFVERK